MTFKTPEKKQARAVQEATGLAYNAALNLVRGLAVLTPGSPDCIIRAALLEAKVTIPDKPGKPCKCPRCDP